MSIGTGFMPWKWAFAAVAIGLICRGPVMAEPTGAEPGVGHVTGIGGVFIKSDNPKALSAWYRDVLGVKIEAWGGAKLAYDAPGHPPVLVWSPFPAASDYMTPSKREFMINFAVDDLDALLARLESKGVTILRRDDTDPNGKFAWILDPDGTKLELWQPIKP
jgi:catechol 2,3-dioxygenase-like lactoylglutathione lyase family enzyme